ncbi:MAG: hypothetical protein K0B09_02495 [Bacteroidales bacterium]|nr:hypothetical protein [Bacteroidales bacterium]
MDFDKWYRTEIESNQEDPPGALWEAIQDDLDTDLVWLRLSGKLPAKKLPLWSTLAMAASVALLVGFAAWFFWYGEFSTTGPAPMAVEEAPAPVQETTSGTPEIVDPTQSQQPVLAMQPLQSQRKAIGDSPSLAIFEPEDKDLFVARNEGIHVIRSKPAREIATATVPETNIKTSAFNSLEAEFLATVLPEKTAPRFSIGLTGQFANTWLLNQKTLRGLQSQELTNTHASFGKNFGLTTFVPLSARSGLKSELFLFSQSRQNYNEYIAGQYASTGLALNYTSITLQYSQRFGRGLSPHMLSLGVYASALLQAREFEGRTAQRVKDQYSDTDLGLVAGYEYLIPLSGQLFLGTGIFAKYGLTNAFSGNQEIPSYLNRTRNAAFVFSLSLNYAFE